MARKAIHLAWLCLCCCGSGELPGNSNGGLLFALFEPVAVGGLNEFRIFDPKNSSSSPDDFLVQVTSADTEVVAVQGFDQQGFVTIAGLSPGSANIDVVAQLGGEEINDSFTMTAAVARQTELAACLGQTLVAVQPDSEFSVFYELRGDDGRIGGYGFHPFEVRPPSAATLLADSSLIAKLRFLAASSTVTDFQVASTIDEARLDYRVVAPSTNWTVEFPSVPANAQKGDRRFVDILARADGVAVCQALDFDVEIQSNTHCGLVIEGESVNSASFNGQGFFIDFLDEGQCSLSLVLKPKSSSQRPTTSLNFTVIKKKTIFSDQG